MGRDRDKPPGPGDEAGVLALELLEDELRRRRRDTALLSERECWRMTMLLGRLQRMTRTRIPGDRVGTSPGVILVHHDLKSKSEQ